MNRWLVGRVAAAIKRRGGRNSVAYITPVCVVISAFFLQSCSQVDGSPFALREQPLFAPGHEIRRLIENDFVAYDPDYRKKRTFYGARLLALAGKLAATQAAGNQMACSNQIFLEAKWLYHYTADWQRLDRRLGQLSASLNDRDQTFGLAQSRDDGMWGVCYDEWFLKVGATFQAIEELYDEGRTPAYPIGNLERISSPRKLRRYIEELLISDIAKTGRDNRAELVSMTSILSATYFKEYLETYLREDVSGEPGTRGLYPWDSFEAIYFDLLSRWQDRKTGFWGAWYRTEGGLYRTADLSMTYHTIAYRGGRVDRWPQIIETLPGIRREPYPYGWLHDGHINNHNAYDVARIMKLGWAYMDDSQRRRSREAIGEMLDWTLGKSLDESGGFKIDLTFFDSLAAEYYFGVSFLDLIGYWNPARRFWTDADFPDSVALCYRIKKRLAALGLDQPAAREALRRLDDNCPGQSGSTANGDFGG